MTTQTIINQDREIVQGKFCLIGSRSQGGASGGFEPIPVNSLVYPEAGKMIIFDLPDRNYNYRYSINVNGVDIEGTVKEVAETLYYDHDILSSYTMGKLIFTCNDHSGDTKRVAVKGLTYLGGNPDPTYCKYLINGDIGTFSIYRSGDFAMLYKNYDVSTNQEVFNYKIHETPTTPQLNSTGTIKTSPYQNVDDLYISLSEKFNQYIGEGGTVYSTVTGEFRVWTNRWFDFTKEPTNVFDLDLGYAPYLGLPT